MQKGFFISDRSGFRYRLDQRTKEPGTGFIVAKSESDGIYNLVTDPLNKVKFYRDKQIIKDARPPSNADLNKSWNGITTKWEDTTTKWNFTQELRTMPRAYFNAKKDMKKKKPAKKKTAKRQGYKDREDESLGMRRGKASTKKQSYKSRRDEAQGARKKKSSKKEKRSPVFGLKRKSRKK